ncbi:putative reverse transcriptase domain-containing protein, partial [Tanacetum coccineum]
EEDMPPQRRFVLTAPPPGCDVVESSASAAARAPRGQYDFVDAVEAGHGLIRSPGHDTQTIARAADRAEDVSYVRALQTSEHKMMTSIEEVNLRVSYQAQIDAVRGQRTAYETELHERQRAKDDAVRQMMRTHVLEARAQIDTDDAIQSSGGGLRRPVQPARVCSYTNFMKCQPLNFKGTEGVVGLSQWLKKIESIFHISGCAVDNQVKFATCTLLGVALTWWNGHVRTLCHDVAYAMTWGTLKKKVRGYDVAAYTQRFQELALMCTKFLADETEKVDKYISGLPDNIWECHLGHTLLALVKRRLTLEIYPCAPSETTTTPDNVHPSVEIVYGHATNDCRVNTNNNNNNKNQKSGACYECSNTGHIKKNCPKLENRRNGNGNGIAEGRAYALGGRDASPDSNVIT